MAPSASGSASEVSGLLPPRKRLGQHFLIEPAVIDEIVEAVGVEGEDLVEIGPGRGALTRKLAEGAHHLIAIEKDPQLAQWLQRQLADCPQAEVRCADALREDLRNYPAGLRLVGNLPYNVATELLMAWYEVRTHLKDLTVMVQREVAERLLAAPGSSARGRLSVITQLYMDGTHLFNVAPECFDPPPKVHSTVLRLVPKEVLPIANGDCAAFSQLVRRSFAARRKTLRNNLPEMTPGMWQRLGIDAGRRAETLNEQEYVALLGAMTAETSI